MSKFSFKSLVLCLKYYTLLLEFAGEIASRFHITKYPTLKVIRNGQPAKREYRGQRSAEAFVEFVKKQLEDPIKEFTELNDLKNLDVSTLCRMFYSLL